MYAEFLRAGGIAQALTEGGADPNLTDTQGKQAKDYAALSEADIMKVAKGNNVAEGNNMAGTHVVIAFAIALANKSTAEKDFIEEIVPKR